MTLTDQPLARFRAEVQSLSNPSDAEFLQGYFKTGPGDYGEGDRFLGIRLPVLRNLARTNRDLSLQDTLHLLRSEWHEERLLALLILVEAFSRGDAQAREEIYRSYLEHTNFINNWDLVDVSADRIVGASLGSENLDPLLHLARSDLLWERRIAIISTFHFIKTGTCAPTLRIAEVLLGDPHHLIHKAVGWMLREVGKRDLPVEQAFLKQHGSRMPRTMLRYAIERFPEPMRQEYLSGFSPAAR